MKNTSTKRILALLLALVMMFGLYPISAIAYDVEDAEPEITEIAGDITAAETVDGEEKDEDKGEADLPPEEENVSEEGTNDLTAEGEITSEAVTETPEVVEEIPEVVEETPEAVDETTEDAEEPPEEEEIEIPEPDPYEFYFKETGTLVSVSDVPEDGARSVEYIKDAAK